MKLKSSWHLLFQNVSSAQIAAKNLFVEPKLRISRTGAKGSKLSRNTSTGMSVICIVELRSYSVAAALVIADVIIGACCAQPYHISVIVINLNLPDQLFYYYNMIILTKLGDIPFNTHTHKADSGSSTSGERATPFNN